MKTHTEYDFRQLLELQRVACRTYAAGQTLRKRAFYLTWGSCCLGIGVFMASHGDTLPLALLLVGAGLFLLVRYLLFYHLMAWGAGRDLKPEQRSNDFAFEEKYILAGHGDQSAKYSYSKCYELIETPGCFYFIMDSGQGLMLSKENLSGGSVDELRSLLEERTGKAVTNVKL